MRNDPQRRQLLYFPSWIYRFAQRQGLQAEPAVEVPIDGTARSLNLLETASMADQGASASARDTRGSFHCVKGNSQGGTEVLYEGFKKVPLTYDKSCHQYCFLKDVSPDSRSRKDGLQDALFGPPARKVRYLRQVPDRSDFPRGTNLALIPRWKQVSRFQVPFSSSDSPVSPCFR